MSRHLPQRERRQGRFRDLRIRHCRVEQIPQTTSPSLREVAVTLRREAHTPLQLITDDEYASGLARLHGAAETECGPVIDALDLLVLR